MKLMLEMDIPQPERKITYKDGLLLMGSCFTENVGKALDGAKFSVMNNPAGIVFDPLSLAAHLDDFISGKRYTEDDLFLSNEVWKSWLHHSDLSSTERGEALRLINESTANASQFLSNSSWVVITLGTAYSYRHIEKQIDVANCHKAPSQWFEKRLLSTDEIFSSLKAALEKLFGVHEKINVVLTVSPVRHVRDGVVENSRSKARLLEAVHLLTEHFERCMYFPSYELVLDVLRDYRFFDADLVHPNKLATQYVFERFCSAYMDDETLWLMEEIRKVTAALSHRPQHPATNQHRQFLQTQLQKVKELQQKLPALDWKKELEYFSS